MPPLVKKLVDFFLFSSLFLAGAAVLMCMQTFQFAGSSDFPIDFLLFIFSASLCSYNFHWMLTPPHAADNHRNSWSIEYRIMHWVLFLIGGLGIFWWRDAILPHWPWILVGAVLTFLYSAPKIPAALFGHLKKYAIGKTIFLAMVWMYVTTVLPLVAAAHEWDLYSLLFCCSRFFLIYAICILFDYRDREADIKEGIVSMITRFSEKGIDRLFRISMVLYLLSVLALIGHSGAYFVVANLLPALLLWWLYPYAKRNFSAYLYYFVLDGLMMFSSLLTVFLPI